MDEPCTDLLIRIRQGSRSSYPVEAWLSDGSFYEGTARLTGRVVQRLLESDLEPERYGNQLFKAVFDGPIKAAYDMATGLARRQSSGLLRVRLLLDDSAPPHLHALKWERLADLEATPLAISDLTPFSRYMTLPKEEPDPLDEHQIRLFVVVSAPSDLDRLPLDPIDVEKEVRRLLTALEDITRGDRFQATLLHGQTALTPELCIDLQDAGWTIAGGAASLDNISEHLRDQHILHLLGHGRYRAGQGELLLEKEDGTHAWEAGDDLATRLSSTPVRLVFLAACESARSDGTPAREAVRASTFEGLAARLVRREIPAVVAMQEQVHMDAAYRLTGEFYRRLFLEHGVVDRALNEARAMLYREEESVWATPVLTMRLNRGKLATANPVWSALHAISRQRDYLSFQTGDYVSLSLQAVPVDPRQDASQYEVPEAQRIGTLDLVDTILSYLAPGGSAAGNSAAPLVLVLGGPSTSKTTQIKRVGWETVQAGLRGRAEDIILPLYLDLENYRPIGSETTDALEAQILDKLRPVLPGLAARSLAELSESETGAEVRLRILLSAGDTLPEAGRDLVRLAARLARDHPQHQYVLAIQPSSLCWDDVKAEGRGDGNEGPVEPRVLAIQPLTQRGIRHALEALAHPPARNGSQGPDPQREVGPAPGPDRDLGHELLHALYNTSLFDLASTPFFLVRMLMRAKQGQTPASRAQVLQQVIDEAIAQIPAAQGMRANAPRTLFGIAWEMQRGEITVWPVEEAFRAMSGFRGERGYAIEELYAALVEQELLLPVGEDAVRFAYSSLQAYCCARAILALPEPGKVLCELVGSLGSPVRTRWWEETLVVASGLLAADPRPRAQQTLLRLLEPIIEGTDLVESSRVFLGARCLLECRSVLEGKAGPEAAGRLQKLVDHVVNALLWHADSASEPDLAERLQATQFLAQLPRPKIAVDLARQAYSKVRRNATDEWDYEFGSVRFAAAIALQRMAPAEAAAALTEINPKLVELFAAWQNKDVEVLLRHSQDSTDLGLQGLAALALGDLHAPLESLKRTEDARRALDRLAEMFTGDDIGQSVRWSVADALSLVDSTRVTPMVVNPLLAQFSSPADASSSRLRQIRNSLAYLIGLLRLRDEQARSFLVHRCLGLEEETGSRDWKTWATAITALGRIASGADVKLLAEFAAGRAEGRPLHEIFPQEGQRNAVRREAINALANQGNLEVLGREDRDWIAREPALSKAYYRAIQEIYWRREGTARTAPERNG